MKILLISKLLLLSLLAFTNCTNMEEDDFYKQKMISRGHSDCIPLIKPYKAIEDRIDNKWEIDFRNKRTSKYNPSLADELFNCDSINIIDGVIIARCSGKDCSYDQDKYEEIYYLIIPSQKVEEVFFSYKEFLGVFKKHEMDKEPVFLSADDINQNWQKKDVLPWGKIESAFERKE